MPADSSGTSPQGFSTTGSFAQERRPGIEVKAAWYRGLDYATEGILYLLLLAAPWCFGATEEWSIWSMTAGSWFLGGLLLGKQLLRRSCSPNRVRQTAWLISVPADSPATARRWLLLLMGLTAVIL